MNDEITLSIRPNGNRLVWFPDRERPLQMRRGARVLFAAAVDDIFEWSSAPALVVQSAERIVRDAGKTPDPANMLIARDADFVARVFIISTPDIVRRLRELLPAARKLHAEIAARKAAEEAAETAALERRREEVRAACPADCEPCTLGRWFDGLRECIAADGTRVDQWDDIDSHGCGIAYVPRDVLDERRARDAEWKAAAAKQEAERQAEKRAFEQRRATAFAEARATGKRVEIRHYATTRCMNGNDDECSLDNAYEYAMPDGTTKTIYVCAF